MTSGILVIDKPRGPTSHDVVAHVRRSLGVRRIGHAGTLDPMATGVLVLAVGEATKLVPWLTAQDKAYEATIALGAETDTLDAEGRTIRVAAIGPELRSALSASLAISVAPILQAVLAAERARSSQVPPSFSAIKRDGERAYTRARRGVSPALEPRDVVVRSLHLGECTADPPRLSLALVVGKGYYVRALARDLTSALGTVGHLTRLRRTRSGCFLQDEAVALDVPSQELQARIHPLSRVVSRVLPVGELTDAGARDARYGLPVHPGDLAVRTGGPSAWLDRRGELVAIGNVDEVGYGRVLRGFTSSFAPRPPLPRPALPSNARSPASPTSHSGPVRGTSRIRSPRP
jgi:tRNA pseudouridine55 synthase